MDIVYTQHAEDFLKKCEPTTRRRILKKMRFFVSSAEPLEFAEHLTDDKDAPYRFRIGKDWRVKFSIEKDVLVVKKIGRRDKIYED